MGNNKYTKGKMELHFASWGNPDLAPIVGFVLRIGKKDICGHSVNTKGNIIEEDIMNRFEDLKESNFTEEEMKANGKRLTECWSQYDKLKEDNALLIEALEPLANLAQAVFEDTKKEKEGVLYAFNKAEIKYSDLRKVTELLNNLKK